MKHLKTNIIIMFAALALPGILSAESFTREDSREFSADSIQKVDIRSHAGKVTVSGWDQPTIDVKVVLKAKASNQETADELFDKAELSFVEEDSSLNVVLKVPSSKGSWFSFKKKSKGPGAEITVKVPNNMNLFLKTGAGVVTVTDVSGELTLATGSGVVSGSNLAGTIDAGTGSGEIKLETVKGSLHAHTGSGGIQIDGMDGSLHARTGSGSINANGQINQFNAKTGSGGVMVNSSIALLEDSKVGTGSGSVTINLPQSAGFSLSAGTGSGSVSCDFDLVDPVAKKRSLKGATANDGPDISIGTGSGNIAILSN